MATVVTTELLNAMLGAPTHSVVDFDTDNMDFSLLDQTDSGTVNAATVDYDEVDTPTVVATGDLGSPSISAGVLSCASPAVTFSSVSGDAADYLILWKNSGTPATSPVCIVWDSATTGLPVTPNGGDITVTFGSNTVLTLA